MSYFQAPGISNSGLNIYLKSPTLFKYHALIVEEEQNKDALMKGTLVHLALLEPDLYKINKIVKPTDKMAKVCELHATGMSLEDAFKEADYYQNLTEASRLDKFETFGKAYYESIIKQEEGIFISTHIKRVVDECVNSVKTNTEAMQYLEPFEGTIYKEHEIYWTRKELVGNEYVDIQCKAKLDFWTYDEKRNHVILGDLKTTSKGLNNFMFTTVLTPTGFIEVGGSFFDYRYYRQLAYYLEAIKNFLGKDDFTYEVVMIVVETNGRFESAVLQIDNKYIDYGKAEYEILLNQIAERELYSNWSFSFTTTKSLNTLCLKHSDSIRS